MNNSVFTRRLVPNEVGKIYRGFHCCCQQAHADMLTALFIGVGGRDRDSRDDRGGRDRDSRRDDRDR